ncbi:YkvA family protein [Romboutsia sp. Marseille-P6047]|uniref:YkvA family protein n=1 Tax=Romboutsia sp. Marseille-P6047 TaxID=2161817 RepID=UPI000F047080|nr:YkvA family protein [Romboutsia sp. Marseille-P6047]
MEKLAYILNLLLDKLKKILVRFKNSKFGLLFIVNIFKIPDFMTDNRVSIISKLKVVFSIAVTVLYFVSAIDFIPEIFLGAFGLADDALVLLWSLGIISEEIEKYKSMIKGTKDPNIIENVDFEIKDDE